MIAKFSFDNRDEEAEVERECKIGMTRLSRSRRDCVNVKKFELEVRRKYRSIRVDSSLNRLGELEKQSKTNSTSK